MKSRHFATKWRDFSVSQIMYLRVTHTCTILTSMSLTLPHLEQFMQLLHAVERVKRFARRPGETTPNTTAEHTFELALLCWYIAHAEKLPLDHEKILKYALAHDLIEAYAGDTPAYDTAGQVDKAAREHAALERITAEFPNFPELIATITAYEAKVDEEARFVYATDKLVDPLNTSMEEGLTHWKERGVTYQDMRTYKDAKIAHHPTIARLWQLLIEKIEIRKDHYFAE
jgi:putative hydrolase of HD superfamily